MSASGSGVPKAVVQVRCVLDEHRSGGPISVTRDKNQCRVDAMIQENCQIKQTDIALKLGIYQERVHHIIGTINYRKFCARWVPRQLTDPMKVSSRRRWFCQEYCQWRQNLGSSLQPGKQKAIHGISSSRFSECKEIQNCSFHQQKNGSFNHTDHSFTIWRVNVL